MSLFYNATTDTTFPHPLDLSLGVLFILVFVISLLLNPISFLYHSKKSALSAALFAYLSVCDFCVTLWNSLHVSELLLQRERPMDHAAELHEIVVYTVYYTFTAYSGLLVNFVLVCKAFGISRPLTVIPRDAVIRLIAAVLGLYTILQILTVVIPGKRELHVCWLQASLSIQYYNSLEVVVWITYVIVFIPGSFSVIVAIRHLLRPSNTNKVSAISKVDCVKMVMMSIPNIAYPICLSYQFVASTDENVPRSCIRSDENGTMPNISLSGVGSTDVGSSSGVIQFITRSALPMVTSAWNPIFIVLCSREIRTMMRNMVTPKKNKGRVNRVNQYSVKLESVT